MVVIPEFCKLHDQNYTFIPRPTHQYGYIFGFTRLHVSIFVNKITLHRMMHLMLLVHFTDSMYAESEAQVWELLEELRCLKHVTYPCE